MSVFIDEVEIIIKAGDGGNGAVAFRREKHVPHGGPDGGTGGRGGSVVFETDQNLSTLLDFRLGKKYKANRGGDGMGNNQSGKDGADLVLKVPVGTQVQEAGSREILADLIRFPQREVIATGGRGGRGNAHFTSSVHQVPRFAEKGEPGEEKAVKLELKLLADVGLLGFPNVGKSTLLAAVSAARPKIADYPFTTLVPNLGVVRIDEYNNFVMADIPGLIENAHQGAGLGIQFLKHLERTRLLLHLLDISGMTGRDPFDDYTIINRELAAFSAELARLPQIIALSRIDIISDRGELQPYISHFEGLGLKVFPISSVTREGLEPLLYYLYQQLREMPAKGVVEPEPGGVVRITVPNRTDEDPRRFTLTRDENEVIVISGRALERIVAMTDLGNEYALRRLQRRFERYGVFNKLKKFGAQEGDSVRIRDMEFEYIEDEFADPNETEVEEEE
jgi:GTP-binding protein